MIEDPMENNEIQSVLMNALSLQEVHVSGDGSHFQVIAVGELFDGMSRVKKQQTVYGPLMEYIAPRFYVSTSKSIIKALINMHSFEIQLSPIG